MAEAEGMKKILELARESEILTKSDTDPGKQIYMTVLLPKRSLKRN